MAFGRSGGALSSPKMITVLVSLLLVALALLSFTTHLPAALAAVKAHRVAVAIAGYAVLLAGVVLRQF